MKNSLDLTVSMTHPALSVLAELVSQMADNRNDEELFGVSHILTSLAGNLKAALNAAEGVQE